VDDIDELTFTRQVLQEAMRFYPPAPVVVRAATQDISIGDHRILKESAVYIPVYALHRRRELWDAPDEFRLSGSAPTKAERAIATRISRSGRAREICIGMGFATTEAAVVLAVLIRVIRLRLRPDFQPTLKLRVTLRPGTGMPMTVQPR
jgi:cytochrome P450